MSVLFTMPVSLAFDDSGDPLPGAKLYFYETGSSTQKNVYLDAALTTPAANPTVADAFGRFTPLWLDVSSGKYRVQLRTSGDVVRWTADDIGDHDELDRSSLGAMLWPRTDAEQSAGVTPTYYYYEPGDVRRYGAACDGITDDSAAIAAALSVGHAGGLAVTFPEGGTCLTSPIVIKAANANIPQAVYGNGVTLKAAAGSTGVFITIENPHGVRPGFTFDLQGGTIDANSLCSTALKIHGMQGCRVQNFDAINATGSGVWLSGESGYGIYYNVIENIRAGRSGAGNGAAGWIIKSIGSGNYIGANAFVNLKAHYNTTYGFDIDWCNGTYVLADAEGNGDAGFNIDNTYSCDFIGGYSEHNNDDVTDTSFVLSSNSTGVKILGGRHIGAITGTTTGLGNFFMPTNKSWSMNYNEDGKLTVANLVVRAGGGIGLAGATPPSNGINGAQGMVLQVAGATAAQFNTAGISATETALLIYHTVDGTGSPALERVTVGALDSGGCGYRLLRIPN